MRGKRRQDGIWSTHIRPKLKLNWEKGPCICGTMQVTVDGGPMSREALV